MSDLLTRLRDMERDGVVTRIEYQTGQPTVTRIPEIGKAADEITRLTAIVAQRTARIDKVEDMGARLAAEVDRLTALAAQQAADLRTLAGAVRVEPDGAAIEDEALHIVQRVTEWDDRTGPDDWPEALLITGDELAHELRRFAVFVRPSVADPDPARDAAVRDAVGRAVGDA